MDAQSLKKYIRKKSKVEYVLEKLGCHRIRHNVNKEYYSATMPDGDNPSGVVIYDTDYLSFVSYSRDIGFDSQQDIYNLIQLIKDVSFVDAIKWLHKLFNIAFEPYHKTVDEPKHKSLMPFRLIKEARGFRPVDVSDIREIEEEALNDFTPILHIDWFNEGIMPWTRDAFDLRYTYRRDRMIIPIRYYADGRLLGFNQRTMVKNWKELGISKYFLTPSYRKSCNIFGLWENREDIEKARRVVVVESEKSVLKRHSVFDGTCVALQGKIMSAEQKRILLSLDVDEIIIALDNDVGINELRSMCEKFYRARKVSYVYDDFGYLGKKDCICDLTDEDKYQQLIDCRTEYDYEEHQKYIKSLGKD